MWELHISKIKSLLVLILLFSVVLSGCVSKEEKLANDAFKEVVDKVQKMNIDIDKHISDAEALIETNEKALDEKAIGLLESAVSTAKSLKVKIPERPKEIESIKEQTEKLSHVDYTSVVKQIDAAKKAYEDSVKQLKQVTAPPESFIIERVQAVEGVTGVSAVTESNDPNKQLGKQGGYTAQVFFSYNLINQKSIEGNSIIEKGTDCGGSVEVYKTAEEAEKRNSYLATFDGGIFSSGHHSVLGTVIVRTSDKLTASQQQELETKVINSLIELK
ncbi:hypothetical protein [Mobiluncus mulieris]|uniref:EbhA n=1 Tax=Mobiluncus mulieris TaxID=2052 RepID=A0ABD4TZL6_9ACTO|nr:hypothetical protein [Mobiluncus mulieris]MCU9969601.1 hypothetical protein [Mobiluncus mulieris]MCU9972486.1 hypothetical protein [Mobiluncus mulieris]MCV0009935.1 hypothetical protein [Mobiluncus mulieris]MCV0012439.1 hypothetical protein [Mobiluncus mulieris]NMW75736.1 hypothetical protein [Mobiluncus mulieris]